MNKKTKKSVVHAGFRVSVRKQPKLPFIAVGGGLFRSKYEAITYAQKNYSDAKIHIEGVRVDTTPIDFQPDVRSERSGKSKR